MPRRGSGNGRFRRDSPGRRDDQYGRGTGHFRAWYPVLETTAQHGPWATHQKAQALPDAVTPLPETASRPASGDGPQTPPDTGLAPQRDANGDRLLSTAGRWLPLHRQPAWRQEPQQRTASQSTHGRVG